MWTGWCGPTGSDGREDGVVLGRDDDGRAVWMGQW
jgi:hypothetical protein